MSRRRSRALGLLAAVAAAALGCGESRVPPTARAALADSADQVMYGAKFNLTDQGVMRAHMEADTAYFFDDNTRVELDDVRATFFTSTGLKDALLTSNRGRYNTRLGDMVAYGNVVVVNEAGRRLETSELHFSPTRNEFYSDSAFTLTEPGRNLSGVGFRSDPNMNNIRVLRGTSGRAAGTVLPGTAPAAADTTG